MLSLFALAALRKNLLALLDVYESRYPDEASIVARFKDFVLSGETLQGKENSKRHITTSAWVVSENHEKVLLTHHKKLGFWVQLGGHIDEGENWLTSAVREAREESGLLRLKVLNPGLFDIDIHEIPTREKQAAHDHYDLRFLLEADESEPLTVSDESNELAWVTLANLSEYTQEESQLRMARKVSGIS